MARSLVLAVLLLFIAQVSLAQETETLLEGDIRHGGFGGPVVKFTEVNDEFGALVGGRGGWIINDSFVVGAGGYGLVNEDFDDFLDPFDDRRRLSMGYGGLELEYIHRPNDVAHMSAVVLVGAGGLVWDLWNQFDNWDDDVFFIAEPALNVLLNVTRHFRVGFGASYRFAGDVELEDLQNRDISGLAGVVTLKFGGF